MARALVDSPIGPLGLVASDRGLCSLLFGGGGVPAGGRARILDDAAAQLDAYFHGDLVAFDLPLELHGTDFQRGCWLALASIPYGQTVSYGEQARPLRGGRPPGSGSATPQRARSGPRTAATHCRSSCPAIA